MPYRAWLRHVGRSLAERLDRLRGTFETLRERLRDAVAQAIGQSVAGAVHEAVHTALTDSIHDPPSLTPRLSQPATTVRPFWRDPNDPYWGDDPHDWREPGMEEEPPPSPTSAATRWRQVLLVGCASVGWWLRQSGQLPLIAALLLGLLSAALVYCGRPLVAAGMGLMGSLLHLWNLTDLVRAGAAGSLLSLLRAGNILLSFNPCPSASPSPCLGPRQPWKRPDEGSDNRARFPDSAQCLRRVQLP